MNSPMLEKARRFEEEARLEIADGERPRFHLSAYTGWLNDPNGFSYYNGKYHLFYQYYPYESHWGPMHWGHAVSGNLLEWEYLPAALAPDMYYDSDGCFSGSAYTLPDGSQALLYTGVHCDGENGSKVDTQTQNLAVGDGLDYQKYDGNPIIAENMLPAGASKSDFRDPKVWQEKDGSYSCVAVSRAADGSGQVLFYRSKDGYRWRFESVLVENKKRFGMMWECPDFFLLDGKWVLLVSPMDMQPQGFEYHSGNNTICLMGDFDEEKGVFIEQSNQSMDYGIDFYATQTMLAPDGRRILIAWMQNPDAVTIREPHSPWAGQMCIPRELSVKDGRLYQKPVRELERYRGEKVAYEDVSVTDGDGVTLAGVAGRVLDMELIIRPKDKGNIYTKFEMRFAKNDEYFTRLSFRPHEGVLKLDREFSGSRRAIVHQRRCLVDGYEDVLKLRVILDLYSVEVFINDGRQVMNATIYTEPAAEEISFHADGEVRLAVEKYGLEK